TFYIVIDRNGETENVYFLNLVDEADLMALMESEEGETAVPTCSCTDKCVIGAINTNCEICHSNMSECVGKDPVVEPEPTEPTEEPDEDTSYEDMEREPYEASRSTETASEQSAPASASEQEQGSSAAQNESPAAASPAAPAPTRNAIIETDDEVLE
ncbi:DUF4366 domain-containing protein, partial [uncultured Fibrobacter sp.]|uniref:DUF4366 domain-containing protein n=1 Tax=uncultured Fibrobacter sp. TaxID=261512 RepID=UPI002606125D